MGIAQIMSNPPAAASPGGETLGAANAGTTADLFHGKLFASLLAADASSEGRRTQGAESAPVGSRLAQSGSGTTVPEMLPCCMRPTDVNGGMLPEELKNARMADMKKYPAMPLPADDNRVNVEEITSSPESSGLLETLVLRFRETGNGVQLEVSPKENGTADAGKAGEGKDSEQCGILAAVSVLQEVFSQKVPEADSGTRALLETAPPGPAGMNGGPAVGEKDVPGYFHNAAAGEKPADQLKLPVRSSEADGMGFADNVKELTSLPAATSTGATSAEQPSGSRGDVPIKEVVKAAGGKGDAYSQGSMNASTAAVSSRAAAFSKAIGAVNGTEPRESHRKAEETRGIDGNGTGSSGLSPTTNDTEATLRDDFTRQESKGGTAARDFSVKQDLAGNFEVPRTASGDKPDAVAAPLDKETINETVLRQVREKLAAPLPGKDTGKVTLRLNPRELGDLTIDIRMENRNVAIEISAQNAVVKEALMQHLDTLKETLARQNITMERFDVSAGAGHGADHSNRQERQQAQQQSNGAAFPFEGYRREETVQARHTDWLPREHSLVDMRW